jgi:hypothetical protein
VAIATTLMAKNTVEIEVANVTIKSNQKSLKKKKASRLFDVGHTNAHSTFGYQTLN